VPFERNDASDAAGDIFATTQKGGIFGRGTVFRIAP
jgi:hypothetical protein